MVVDVGQVRRHRWSLGSGFVIVVVRALPWPSASAHNPMAASEEEDACTGLDGRQLRHDAPRPLQRLPPGAFYYSPPLSEYDTLGTSIEAAIAHLGTAFSQACLSCNISQETVVTMPSYHKVTQVLQQSETSGEVAHPRWLASGVFECKKSLKYKQENEVVRRTLAVTVF
ncbi:uncharacterized protein LOC21404107 [Morus notabilis]|uniref:uncharacterized protein LOC21404107 n=1 Tax=Morus notabilis TaxID=981085 RepID=UPI000CED49F2|nr:uncharacterized protein LOC21404107 [Morus notabilis]XP_024027781.1 uncharacterized protein LOC21404107 [Morus notabilis]XP_024027782.1 uncharacterized protein LOC21404107 [Morus notabilis]